MKPTPAEVDVLWALEPYIASTSASLVQRLGWPGDGRSVAPILRRLARQGMVFDYHGMWDITLEGRASLAALPARAGGERGVTP